MLSAFLTINSAGFSKTGKMVINVYIRRKMKMDPLLSSFKTTKCTLLTNEIWEYLVSSC